MALASLYHIRSHFCSDNINSGSAALVPQVLEFEDHNMGYDAATNDYRDMIKAGIIDPLKVRCTSSSSFPVENRKS